MRYLFVILLLSISNFSTAENRPRKLWPEVEVYYQPGVFMAPFDFVRKEVKVYERHARKIFGIKRLKFNFRYSPIANKCSGMFIPTEAEFQFWCLWDTALDVGLDSNNKILHFLVPPLVSRPDMTFWIGGMAFASCWKNLHPNGSAGGFGVSNFVLVQRDGSSRLAKTEAAFLHEVGHSVFGLQHDGADENYLMNTNFNVLGFSEKVPPEMWRLSQKSKKQINKCMQMRTRR